MNLKYRWPFLTSSNFSVTSWWTKARVSNTGERQVWACVVDLNVFGGDLVMVWWGTTYWNRTPLVVRGNLTVSFLQSHGSVVALQHGPTASTSFFIHLNVFFRTFPICSSLPKHSHDDLTMISQDRSSETRLNIIQIGTRDISNEVSHFLSCTLKMAHMCEHVLKCFKEMTEYFGIVSELKLKC